MQQNLHMMRTVRYHHLFICAQICNEYLPTYYDPEKKENQQAFNEILLKRTNRFGIFAQKYPKTGMSYFKLFMSTIILNLMA